MCWLYSKFLLPNCLPDSDNRYLIHNMSEVKFWFSLPIPIFCPQFSFQILPHLSKMKSPFFQLFKLKYLWGFVFFDLDNNLSSCYSDLWSISRIQPLLNTAIAITLNQSICCLDCHNGFPTILSTSLIAPHTWVFTYQPDLNISPMLHLCSKPSSDWLPISTFHNACKALCGLSWLCVWPIHLLLSLLWSH